MKQLMPRPSVVILNCRHFYAALLLAERHLVTGFPVYDLLVRLSVGLSVCPVDCGRGLITDRISVGGNALTSVRPSVSTQGHG